MDNNQEVKQKIDSLRKLLERYSYEYYVLDNPTIDDIEFDNLLKELDGLEKKYPEFSSAFSPTQRVGGEINKDFKQVTHKYPMLSLANTYSKDEIVDFVARAEESLNRKDLEWVCELKYDGLSISLLYEEGVLVRASTRGNGVVGDDVTSNIKTIPSIPLHLQGNDYPQEFEIRGEVIYPHKAFEEFNKKRRENGEEPFANCRNAASGSLKLQDPKEVAKRKLDCYLYFLIGDSIKEEKHYDRLRQAKRWGFKIAPYMAIAKNINEIMDFINYWDKQRDNLPFDIDGIVIKLNDINYWNILGATAKSPRWATAFKFKAEQAKSKLKSVEYQVGRTGIITPVAEFEPVWLGGTWVKRATLHNKDQMDKLNLCLDDTLVIEKGGEIIPKIVACEHDKEKEEKGLLEKVSFIKNCPICNTPLVKEEEQAGYYCPNYNHCSVQILGRFQHFISKKAMNIETLGGEKIRYLLENKIVSDFASLYELSEDKLIGVYSLTDDKKLSIQEKGAKNIITSIERSKQVPFERVLFALGIRYVGEVSAKTIARHFENIYNIINAKKEDLVLVNDVGEIVAESLVSYFSNSENLWEIDRLRQLGLRFNIEKKQTKDILMGKSFVVSGVFKDYSREEIKKVIEDNGGKSVSSLSSKTDFLVFGENMGPEKRKKAEKLNIKMISEEEFNNMLTNTNKE
jgi:DNA ligase (NAD+)